MGRFLPYLAHHYTAIVAECQNWPISLPLFLSCSISVWHCASSGVSRLKERELEHMRWPPCASLCLSLCMWRMQSFRSVVQLEVHLTLSFTHPHVVPHMTFSSVEHKRRNSEECAGCSFPLSYNERRSGAFKKHQKHLIKTKVTMTKKPD